MNYLTWLTDNLYNTQHDQSKNNNNNKIEQLHGLLHCSNLDELLEQNGSFHQVLAEAQLRHHPVLHLVEPSHKSLQVGCDGTREFMATKHVVDQLQLEEGRTKGRLKQRHFLH